MSESSRAFRRLAALAAGICQDGGIRPEVGGCWAFDPVRRVIVVDRGHLHSRSETFCLGLLSHEAGHVHVTRYHYFRLPRFPCRAALLDLFNACEDARAEEAIRRLYPGTAVWLREAADEKRRLAPPPVLPEFLRYCFECARGADGSRADVPPRVARALAATADARREYATTLPPASRDPRDAGREIAERYRIEVEPRLAGDVAAPPAPPWERVVRLRALEAVRIAEDRIVPVALTLWRKDVERVATHLEAEAGRRERAEAAFREDDLRAIQSFVAQALCDPETPGSTARPSSLGLAEGLLGRIYEARRHPRRGRTVLPEGFDVVPVDDPVGRSGAAGAAGRVAAASSCSPTYEAAREGIAGQVDRLARELEEVLRPRRRSALRRGHPTGRRIDLRRAMQFDADRRRYEGLWMRSAAPDRHRTALLLLVDLSGSMRGEKIQAAMLGSVLLAETALRLSLDFALYGFQDELIPFRRFDEPFDDAVRAAIGTMAEETTGTRRNGRNRPSFNDDGPVLAEAAELLSAQPADDRLLIAISDGLPEGRRSSEADLRRAVADIEARGAVDLCGIGIGPGTGHVRDYYPDARADVPVDRLAEEIAAVLRSRLLGPRRGARKEAGWTSCTTWTSSSGSPRR